MVKTIPTDDHVLLLPHQRGTRSNPHGSAPRIGGKKTGRKRVKIILDQDTQSTTTETHQDPTGEPHKTGKLHSGSETKTETRLRDGVSGSDHPMEVQQGLDTNPFRERVRKILFQMQTKKRSGQRNAITTQTMADNLPPKEQNSSSPQDNDRRIDHA